MYLKQLFTVINYNIIEYCIGLVIFCGFLNSCNDNNEPITDESTEIITNQTIYKDENNYCAFCDISYYRGKYYIAFRLANNHAPTTENDYNGYIKIISSSDGKTWENEIDVIDEEWDLRDPCFCINTDDDILSLNYGLFKYNDRNPEFKNKRVVFSEYNGKLSIDKINIIDIKNLSHFWIWKVYFHNNKYWGVGYFEAEYPILVCSDNGISYSVVSEIQVPCNETALLFDKDELLAVSRPTDTVNGQAIISLSKTPYENWTSYNTEYTIACPEIVQTDNGRIFVCGRNEYGISLFSYNNDTHTLHKYLNLFALGKYGDKGYPGMLYLDGKLFIVYYACNDYASCPSIYLTTIKID